MNADVCREHGIGSATFYKWKAKFGGLEVSDARKLKALEDENAKLKARTAITEDGASSLVLGCAGMAPFASAMQEASSLPAIDAVASAVGLARTVVFAR